MGRSKGIAARERTSPPADFGWRISGSDGLRSSCLCGSFALATVEPIRLRDGGRSPPQRPLPYETTETPVVRQSQRDCVLQPRVAESARLPWVSVRADFNPTGVVSPLRHRATPPLADTTRFSQGSSRLATLGLGAESLWDSAGDGAPAGGEPGATESDAGVGDARVERGGRCVQPASEMDGRRTPLEEISGR